MGNQNKTPPYPLNRESYLYKRELALFKKIGYNDYEKLVGYRINIIKTFKFKKQKYYSMNKRIRIGQELLTNSK